MIKLIHFNLIFNSEASRTYSLNHSINPIFYYTCRKPSYNQAVAAYCIPNIHWFTVCHVILSSAFRYYYYSHFKEMETEAQKLSNWSKGPTVYQENSQSLIPVSHSSDMGSSAWSFIGAETSFRYPIQLFWIRICGVIYFSSEWRLAPIYMVSQRMPLSGADISAKAWEAQSGGWGERRAFQGKEMVCAKVWSLF